MLIVFILTVLTFTFAYLYVNRISELKKLQKYTATIENDLLQKEIKLEQLTLQTAASENLGLANAIDSVTGLPAMSVFEDRAMQTFNANKRLQKFVGILLLSIDNLSDISNEIGQDKSNVLLNEVAKKLNGCIRQLDTVSHFQKNVFIFLLPQLSQPDSASIAAQRILSSVDDIFYIDDKPISIQTHFGISIFPLDGENLKNLYDHANDAIQKSRLMQQRVYFYNTEIQQINQRKGKIRVILQSPDLLDKLKIYCLPQVDAKTNVVVGIKALPYIYDDNLGLLSFEEYGSIAENENKMTIISEWLITQVIEKYKAWKKLGIAPHRIAISITIKQMQDVEFVQKLSKIFANNDFEPKNLAFEISADDFSGNILAVQEGFASFSHLGVQISIGVFALGHLAMKKITNLPITYLKIDNRLIKNMSQFSTNEFMLIALMEVSHTLGLETIAEGVDELTQKHLLESLGFNLMQGKLFGDPQPIEFFHP